MTLPRGCMAAAQGLPEGREPTSIGSQRTGGTAGPPHPGIDSCLDAIRAELARVSLNPGCSLESPEEPYRLTPGWYPYPQSLI